MQYLLSQDEMDQLVKIEEVAERDIALEYAKNLILKLAKRECEGHNRGGQFSCSSCPVSAIQHGEGYGVPKPAARISELLCRSKRYYPK